ncbi:MAG: hypothetical protein L0323_07245 [Planctomycetes bacterium]|nr:hypothetical protein [Planctomycetota bacterium]
MGISFQPFGSPFGWILTIGFALFWVLALWRIMRAHERLASAMEKFERATRPGDSGGRP